MRATSPIIGVSCLILLLLSGGFLSGCSDQAPKGAAQRPPVPVRAGEATIRSIPLQVKAVGTVEPRSTVEIRSRVGGQLVAVHFREGDDVRKGAALFTIDPAPFQIALRQAEARLQKDQALAVTAGDKAKRYLTLTGEGLISRQDFELVKAEADSLEATVTADRAAIEEARLQLGWTRIAAPISGRTGSLMVHEGDLVGINGSQPLLTIHQMEPIDISFTLAEKELAKVRSALAGGRLPVTALIPGEEQNPVNGELTFIDNAVDSKTGTIRLKASFVNTDRRLWPGQFTRVLATLATFDKATVVPTAAVQTGQQGTFVVVVKSDGTAEMRPVRAGISHEEMTIIREGVKPGETVVIDGHLRLTPGARVEIRKP